MSNQIGKNIRQLRKKNNLSQAIMAKALGISIPAFSKIEAGITDINISRLNQLAAYFEVTTSDILFGEEGRSEHKEAIENLKEKLAQREQELFELQSKLITLYEKLKDK
ncbi:transcriptional regulator [Pedobacter sp. HMWF019]|nr:transcriptional regulator [Pedobacter sp. HMWF019]